MPTVQHVCRTAMRGTAAVAAAAAVLAVGGTGCSATSSGKPAGTTTAAQQTVQGQPVTSVVTKVVTRQVSPQASSGVRTSSKSKSASTHAVKSKPKATRKAPASSHPAPNAGAFTMPNEIGKVLQTGQDDIQRVSADPVFFSHSHDELGNRFQILDRDWKICNQNIQAGNRVSSVGHIDFGVVKLEERCP